MKKILTAVSAAAVLVAATMTNPTPASAHAWWVVPAIIGGAVIATGAVIAAQSPAYARAGNIYVEPRCHYQRQRVRGGWRNVQVCR